MALKTQSIGLYGPVILIDQLTYNSIDGHMAAKESIIDDVALGEKLMQTGHPFKLFMGGKDISFRMYNTFESLIQGWIKNYASGAVKTPIPLLVLISLWIASCITSVFIIAIALNNDYSIGILVAACLYLCWVYEFYRLSHK